MAEGVSTRLQKDVSQLQKDLEQMGSKLGSLETRIEGIAGQIRTDLCLDLKKDLEEMFEKWGRKVEQMVSPTKDTITEKMTTAALEVGSPGGQQKST